MRALLAILLFTCGAHAQSIKFEPLFGVEHATNRYPEPARATTRTFFGLRVLAGVPLLSLELEATQANDRRDYPSEDLKAEDQIRRGLIGVRSTVPTTSWLAVFFRAGARATQQETTITNTADGTKDVKKPPVWWDPYAGSGLTLALGSLAALNAGATWFFPQGAPAEVQYSFGFTLKFGQTR